MENNIRNEDRYNFLNVFMIRTHHILYYYLEYYYTRERERAKKKLHVNVNKNTLEIEVKAIDIEKYTGKPLLKTDTVIFSTLLYRFK